MKKNILLILFIILTLFFTIGCSKDGDLNPVSADSDDEEVSTLNQNSFNAYLANNSDMQCHSKSIFTTHKIDLGNHAYVRLLTWWGRNNKLYAIPLKIKWNRYNKFIIDCSEAGGKKAVWKKRRRGRWFHWSSIKILAKSQSHENVASEVFMINQRTGEISEQVSMTLPENEPGDTTAPTPGNSGIINITDFLTTSISLSWTRATDDISASTNLQYLVYYSTSDNISTVAEIEANGTPVGNYAYNLATLNVTGLNPLTTYYFNIIVKDEAGNKSAYLTQTETTFSQEGFNALIDLHQDIKDATVPPKTLAAFATFKLAAKAVGDCVRIIDYGKNKVITEWYLDAKANLQSLTLSEANKLDSSICN